MKNLDELLYTKTPTLLQFFATWCGHCNKMKPMIDKLESEMIDRLKIIRLDLEDHQQLAREQKVMVVPTFIFFKEGEEIWRHSGEMQFDELKTQIGL